MKKLSILFVSIFLLFVLVVPVSSAPLFKDSGNTGTLKRSAEAGFAEEEFRRGVQSYYRGYFNDAIVQFEKALSYLPDENLILDWLGKSYYRAGLEGTALEQWQFALDNGYGGLLLENKIEVVRERRVTGFETDETFRYTETGSFAGKIGDTQIFSQPVSVLADPDGTIWVTAYGSNELLHIDVNGNVIRRITGPVNGFDRPVDVIRLPDENLLVTESAGDRLCVLSKDGFFQKYIGTKGRGNGELLGPQYASCDMYGNIFVTDFGNRRVMVFDKEGNGLFSFGNRTSDFDGLKGPTGIAIKDMSVYVADCVTGGVYEFDLSGNYVDVLVKEKTFKFPEAMKFTKNGDALIISDRARIYTADLSTGAVVENAFTGNAPSRITAAVPDQNGNIIASDFTSNEVYILAKMTELLGGLYVEIERVHAEAFPNVTVEVRVQNRARQPVVGLKEDNFYITEEKRTASKVKFEGASDNNTNEDFIIVIDRSVSTDRYGQAINACIRELAASMQGVGTVRLISSGAIPVEEYYGDPSGLFNFSYKALKAPESSTCSFDLSMRLAVNSLINAEPKRGIIYITDGNVPDGAFNKYGLSDITAFMNNNGVSFSVIQLAQKATDEELNYITRNTNGKSYYVYRKEGLGNVVKEMLQVPNGLYRFSFVSSLPTDMGRSYLPVEVEAYILNRSGRDETGYFAPLQ